MKNNPYFLAKKIDPGVELERLATAGRVLDCSSYDDAIRVDKALKDAGLFGGTVLPGDNRVFLDL